MHHHIRITLSWGKYQARTLKPDEIVQAQTLLYEVYFLERSWQPEAGNPSSLHIRHAGDGLPGRYVDDFDQHAIWLGVFAGPQLLGIARVIDGQGSGGLEVARYCAVPAHLLYRAIELNRLAIRHSHRTSLVHTLLFMLASRVAWKLHSKNVLIAPATDFSRFMQRQGFLHSGISFKYHAEDPLPVDLLYYPVRMSKVLISFASMVTGPLGKWVKKPFRHQRKR